MEEKSTGKCLECGHVLYGRADKKFCSEGCKNKYHNRFGHKSTRLRERTFMDLSTNHRILTNLLKMGMTAITLYDIEALGFKQSLVTGYVRKRGYDELRCFDIRYRQTPERIFEIREIDLDETKQSCRTPLLSSCGTSH